MDISSPNFIHGFIFTRSSLGLLHAIFPNFVPELWTLIYVKITFPLNILRAIDRFHTIFIYMHLYWQGIALDYYTSFFSYLYHSYGLDLRQNLVSAQYLENKLT